jgi:hypothetical protein
MWTLIWINGPEKDEPTCKGKVAYSSLPGVCRWGVLIWIKPISPPEPNLLQSPVNYDEGGLLGGLGGLLDKPQSRRSARRNNSCGLMSYPKVIELKIGVAG